MADNLIIIWLIKCEDNGYKSQFISNKFNSVATPKHMDLGFNSATKARISRSI